MSMRVAGRHTNGEQTHRHTTYVHTHMHAHTYGTLKSMFCRFAILTGATVLHKGIQERIAGGFEFKVY